MAQFAGGREAAIGDLGVKLRTDPDRALDLEARYDAPLLRQGIKHFAQHPHGRIREARPDRPGITQRTIIFDGEFQIGDSAAAVGLIAYDDEGVALNAFDLQPILASTGAIGQVDALRDDPFEFVRAGEIEKLGAVAFEFLAEQDGDPLGPANQRFATLAERKFA
jgi:hypothetical protein